MVCLILAQLSVDIVGGEQWVGGGSGEGSGDTDMVEDARREREGMAGEEAMVGRFFISEEEQGGGVGGRVEQRDDIELFTEGTIERALREVKGSVAVAEDSFLGGGEGTGTFTGSMGEVEDETGVGGDGDGDFVGEELRAVEGDEAVDAEG